ncbi:hypothetical protein BCS71_25785 [Vibrio lentus]|nr:hypothetical protein [Vibrio lentus]
MPENNNNQSGDFECPECGNTFPNHEKTAVGSGHYVCGFCADGE